MERQTVEIAGKRPKSERTEYFRRLAAPASPRRGSRLPSANVCGLLDRPARSAFICIQVQHIPMAKNDMGRE